MNWSSLSRRWIPLSRRAFSKMFLGVVGGLLTNKSFGQQQGVPPANSTDWEHSYGEAPVGTDQTSHIIRYIRDKAPEFQIPPYSGTRYVDTVPDTLDIAERAKLGIHVLTSITDPKADYEIYWVADFARN